MKNKDKIRTMESLSSVWKERLREEFEYGKRMKLFFKEILGEEIYSSVRIVCLKKDVVQIETASSELKAELYMYKRNIERRLKENGLNVNVVIKYKGGNIGE